ncbi:MAG TPA: recombination-associated protein RdgC [Thiotrichaceae bacterium]|jgi:recombination associated protein RdgC|nr:recombination-associated protein RdgC [Thiotrichaceae bacterium]HIM07536.1 recombination-associated protein RdgC [Gammaproteobacteria bacterium]
MSAQVRDNSHLFSNRINIKMWFKNLRIYRLTKDIDLSPETLEAALAEQNFSPCANMDFSKYGWVPPLGKNSEMYTHSTSGYVMICARKQEKILPPAAVNEVVEEKVLDFEQEQTRPIYRNEKRTLKEDVIHSLLPRALTRSYLVYAYFDPASKLLIIDSASANKCEEFMDHLRATLGSLPVVPLKCHGDAANIMTHWLQDTAPKTIELDNECELQNPRESKNIVRCKNQELESEEILTHLKAGKRVTQLAMVWREAIRFILTDDFVIKRLRFEEIIQEQAEGEADDRATQFDQDFAVMVLQLHEFIKELLEEFGGVEKD